MAAQQSTLEAAQAHLSAYAAVILSKDIATTTERAEKMASLYLPNITSFSLGTISPLSQPSNPGIFPIVIASALSKLETESGLQITLKDQRVDLVGEGSAICWLTFERQGIVWSNAYFWRRMEVGSVGWEGGIFDGEARMLAELPRRESEK